MCALTTGTAWVSSMAAGGCYARRSTTSTAQSSGRPTAWTRSEERRVGKECRSLCDWSSDVCSSDLDDRYRVGELNGGWRLLREALNDEHGTVEREADGLDKIGRASCRERV